MNYLRLLKACIYFNILFICSHFIFPLLFISGNIFFQFQFYQLLNYPKSTNWSIVNAKKFIKNPKISIYYNPDVKIVQRILNLVPANKTLRPIESSKNADGIFAYYNPSSIFYYSFNSINNITNFTDFSTEVSLISTLNISVIIDFNDNIQLEKFRSNYFNAIYLIHSAIVNLKYGPDNKYENITYIGGLPENFDRPLSWPGLYLVFLFGIIGCFLINGYELDKAIQLYSVNHSGVYVRLISLIIIYNIIGIIAHFLFMLIMMKQSDRNIITKCSPWMLIAIFTIVYNTGLFTASVISIIKFNIFTALFGTALFIAPQILYVFCYMNNVNSTQFYQHFSLISPILSMGWLLTVIEDLETFDLFTSATESERFTGVNFSIIMLILTNVIFCFGFLMIIVFEKQVGFSIVGKRILKIFKTLKHREKVPVKPVKAYDSYSNIDYSDPSFDENLGLISSNEHNFSITKPAPKTSLRLIEKCSGSVGLNQTFSKRSVSEQKIYPSCIITKRLCKYFFDQTKEVHALKGISVSAHKYSITAFVGPNGSGKSTLIKILGGFTRPTHGYFIIDSVKVNSDTRRNAVFSRVSVFVNSKLKFDFLTLMEYLNLVYAIKTNPPAKIATDTIKQLAGTLQIDNFLNVKLSRCPAVVIRLAQILCPFLMNSNIVLLDEPYLDLDFNHKQNINSLLNERKQQQSIIVTTSLASNIETCADKIVMLFDGKSVIQGKSISLRKNMNFSFKLTCQMEKNAGDYSIIMFIKSVYPEISYESSTDNALHFEIPNVLTEKLADIRNDIVLHSKKCGVVSVRIYRMNFQIYFHEIISKLNNVMIKYQDNMKRSMTIASTIKMTMKEIAFLKMYFHQFYLVFLNGLSILYRFPTRSMFSAIVPLLTVLIVMIIMLLNHAHVISYEQYPDFVDEIIFATSNHAFQNLTLINISQHYQINKHATVSFVSNISFPNFTDHLLTTSQIQPVFYRNTTKVAVYLTVENKTLTRLIILTNFENVLAKVYERSQAFLFGTFEMDIVPMKCEKSKLSTNYLLEKNFMLRMMFIVLVVFTSNLFNLSFLDNYRKRNNLVRTMVGHYSLSFVPKYLLDVVLYLIFVSFIILFIYMLSDFRLMTSDQHVTFLVVILALYGMVDIASKTLFCQLFNFSPSIIMFFLYVDLLATFISSAVSFKAFKIYLKSTGYYFMSDCSDDGAFILLILIPATNLNNGLVSYIWNPSWYLIPENCRFQLFSKAISCSNSYTVGFIVLILLFQWVIFMILLFAMNHPFAINRIKISKFMKLKYFSHCPLFEEMTDSNNIVSLKNVSCSTRNNQVGFVGLNWEVEKSTISLILGPNSSGKSLLCDLLIGFKTPTSGNISFVNSMTMKSKVKRNKHKLSYCNRIPILFNELTISEYFAFWAELRCQSRTEIKIIMDIVLNELDLQKDSYRMIKDLCPSIAKKVCIGTTIVGFPMMIILDDPLSNLDTLSQRSVINLLKIAKTHNSTIIVSATEINDLYNVVDNVILLKDYNVIFQGPWKDVSKHATIGYYLTFIFGDHSDDKTSTKSEIQRNLQSQFETADIVKDSRDFVIYFIRSDDMLEIDYSLFVIFIEDFVKPEMNIIQYIINFNSMG